MTAHNAFRTILRRFLHAQTSLQYSCHRLWYRREMCFYCCQSTVLDLPRPQLFRRNCYEDLRYYEAYDPSQMTIEEYRRESCRRLNRGIHLYTLAHNGVLLYYGWLANRQPRKEEPLMGQVFFPPTDSSVIFDCHTHPTVRNRGLHYQALCQMLHDAREIFKTEQVCIGSLSDNLISRRVIEKIDFRYIGSMIKTRRLFKSQRYAIAVDSRFRTAFM